MAEFNNGISLCYGLLLLTLSLGSSFFKSQPINVYAYIALVQLLMPKGYVNYSRNLKAWKTEDHLWDSISYEVLSAFGIAYAFSRGTEDNIELGYNYFEEAAKLGSEEAENISHT